MPLIFSKQSASSLQPGNSAQLSYIVGIDQIWYPPVSCTLLCFSATRCVLISLLNDSPSPPNPFSHTRTRTTYPLIKMPSKYIKIHSRATNPRFPKFNLTRVFCTTSPYQDPKKSSRVPSKIQDVATSRLSYLAPSTYAFTTRYGTDKKVRGAMKSTRQESVRTTEFNREIPILRPTR